MCEIHCTHSVNLRYCAHVLLSCDILCMCSVNFQHTFNLRRTVHVCSYFVGHCAQHVCSYFVGHCAHSVKLC